VGATTQSDGIVVKVLGAKVHPDYDGFVGNDVAILKLASDVPGNPSIPSVGETMTVIGTWSLLLRPL
jgi:hypothetical protein